MRILQQVSLIFLICLVCEGLSDLLPFPFPGSVLSMLALFLLLVSKRVKPTDIQETSSLLLSNMMLVFVPSFVSIVNYLELLKSIAAQFVVIIVVSTLVTFFVGGAVVTLTIRLQNRLLAEKEG